MPLRLDEQDAHVKQNEQDEHDGDDQEYEEVEMDDDGDNNCCCYSGIIDIARMHDMGRLQTHDMSWMWSMTCMHGAVASSS